MVDLISTINKVQLLDPTIIINPKNPETVILSKDTYDKLIKRNMELEEKLFDIQLQSRINDGPGELIDSDKVIESSQEHNPFSSLSDKDLFD